MMSPSEQDETNALLILILFGVLYQVLRINEKSRHERAVPWIHYFKLFLFPLDDAVCGHLLLAEDVEIEDLKDAERVHDKENDEPNLAVGPCRFPEGEAFPDDAPDDHREEQDAADKRKAKSRRCP